MMSGDFDIALDGLQDRWPPRSNHSMAYTLIQFLHKSDLIDKRREKTLVRLHILGTIKHVLVYHA